MTRHDWLSSTDPAAMFRFVRARLTEKQAEWFVRACREGAIGDSDGEYWTNRDWHLRANDWAMGTFPFPTLPVAARAHLLREIVGDPFAPVRLPTRRQLVASVDVIGGRELADTFAVHEREVVDCPWLWWNDRTIPKLAQSIHDERRFDELPILGDALSDANCREQSLIMHCYGKETCPTCLGKGQVLWSYDEAPDCWACCTGCHMTTLGPDGKPVGCGWINLRGPHCRGCWAIELLRGNP